MELHKAALLQIKVTPKHWIKVPFIWGTRIANAYILHIGRIDITWRRSWLPKAVYMEGWNACWRELYYAGRIVSPTDKVADSRTDAPNVEFVEL